VKKWIYRIGVDVLLVALCLYGVTEALVKTSVADWWLLFWVPLLALNTWALEHNVSEMREERRAEEILKAKYAAPTDKEQLIADAARLGVEPVETPDETWSERHQKDCAICRKFLKGGDV
jgi:hypothetical protein